MQIEDRNHLIIFAHCQEKNWNYIILSKEAYGIKFNVPTSKTFDIDPFITLLYTNLLRDESPLDVLRELYWIRWG